MDRSSSTILLIWRPRDRMILVCGEALVDVLVSSDAGPGGLKARFGGAPFNVAVGLSRLGVPSAFFGGLSSDPVGTALLNALKIEGVDMRWVRVSDAPSMMALAGVSPAGDATYSFPITDGADKKLPSPSAILTDRKRLKGAVFGSYLAAHPDTAPLLLELARELGSGTIICFDPNVRLALLPDPEDWKRALENFLPVIDILKISEEDILHIYGRDAPVSALVKGWLGRGVSAVCLTLGAAGARIYTRDGLELSLPAPEIAVADTVGAGDSFLSGLLAHLHHADCLSAKALGDRHHLAQALAFAISAAAFTCQTHGADLPRLEQLQNHKPGLAVADG